MLTISRRVLLAAALLAPLVFPAIAEGGDIPGFDAAMAAGEPVLIHVTATWCEVCQAQKPIVASLLGSPEFSTIKLFEVDFDSQKDVLRRHNVQQQSTMIVFKGGKEVDRQVGQTDPAVIEALLRKAL